jgi:putative tricarboxylic transport membrane protein
MVVALVFGPMMEKTLRQSLFLGRGSVLELVSRPLTASLLLLGALALIGPPLVRLLRRRKASPSSAPAA